MEEIISIEMYTPQQMIKFKVGEMGVTDIEDTGGGEYHVYMGERLFCSVNCPDLVYYNMGE